MNKEIIFAG